MLKLHKYEESHETFVSTKALNHHDQIFPLKNYFGGSLWAICVLLFSSLSLSGFGYIFVINFSHNHERQCFDMFE